MVDAASIGQLKISRREFAVGQIGEEVELEPRNLWSVIVQFGDSASIHQVYSLSTFELLVARVRLSVTRLESQDLKSIIFVADMNAKTA